MAEREITDNRNVRRRDLLQASTGVLGMGLVGTSASASRHRYDVNLFQTEDLTVTRISSPYFGTFEYEDWSYAETFKSLFDRVMANAGQYTDISVVRDPITEIDGFDNAFNIESVLEEGNYETAEDMNLVLQDEHGGGEAGEYCYARAQKNGQGINDLDGENGPLRQPTSESDMWDAWYRASLAIHEIGHSLLGVPDRDDVDSGCRTYDCGKFEHEFGMAYEDASSEFMWFTPMGQSNWNDDCYQSGCNLCGDEVPEHNGHARLIDLEYSDCFWDYAET